jgi:membrane protease YdiL (CAAX protease family)
MLVSGLLVATLLKVLVPVAGIGLMLFVARMRNLSLASDVGLRAPHWGFAALFLALWVLLIAVEEYATRGVAAMQPRLWPAYPPVIIALRILAIGLLGPISEELAFRGVVLAVLRRTRLRVVGAIVLTAALWSVSHLQYAPLLLALIFLDGLVLGAARHFTRSLYVPILMHVAGNLFSISQSLGW